MKVESATDVHPIQYLDKPSIAPAPAPAKYDELPQIFSQEVDINSRALDQRSMVIRVPPVEQLAQLYDQLGHPAQASLAAISRRVRMQLLQSPAPEKMLELAGGDPARAFVVLKYVAAQADIEVRPSEAALARGAIARLEVRFKREIQAGLNTALALQGASEDPQERQALRTLYYASVVTRQSLATMMQALLGVYGSEQFSSGLQVMRKALADDIAALVTSVPTALLRTLLIGLQSCGQLSGVLTNCQTMIHQLGIQQDPVSVLQRLLGYASSGIATAEIQRLVADLGGNQAPRDLMTLNALYPLIQQLPLPVWADARVRQDALQLFMVVMDELARLERGPLGGSAVSGAQV